MAGPVLDALDVALLETLRAHPRAGLQEVARIVGVARATATARLQRMERAGVVTGFGPDVDVTAAGFGVQAFVTLEIAQGALEEVHRELAAIPGIWKRTPPRVAGTSCAVSRRRRTRRCSRSWSS